VIECCKLRSNATDYELPGLSRIVVNQTMKSRGFGVVSSFSFVQLIGPPGWLVPPIASSCFCKFDKRHGKPGRGSVIHRCSAIVARIDCPRDFEVGR